MNKMYEYLQNHSYISKNKKSNYQFELSEERASCIVGKYNTLVEEKDKEIERLNNIINEIKECLSKNRVYITGERNLAFELDDILKGVDK